MSVWTKLIEESGIIEQLQELGPAIDQGLSRDDNETGDIESLERLKTVLTFIGRRMDGADGNLLHTPAVQNVSKRIAATTAAVRSFVEDGNAEHLANANNAIDSALAAFAVMVMPTKTGDLQGLRKAAESYRETMVQQVESYKSQVTNAENEIKAIADRAEVLAGQIDSEKQKFESDVASVTQNLTAAQDALTKRFVEIEEELATASKAQLDLLKATSDEFHAARAKEHQEAAASQHSAFNDLLEKYETDLEETNVAWTKHLAERTQAYEAAQTEVRKNYEERASATLATIEGHLARVKELVGAIGDHGVTAGFKQEADNARKEVVYWQRVAFSSMFFLILVGVATALHLFADTLTWMAMSSRLYLSIVTGAMATYAASQANRYQQRERSNRKLELELRALGPFLEPVEPAEREKFRLKIAEVFFGKDDGIGDKPGPTTAFQISKESGDKVLELLNTLVSKLPGK